MTRRLGLVAALMLIGAACSGGPTASEDDPAVSAPDGSVVEGQPSPTSLLEATTSTVALDPTLGAPLTGVELASAVARPALVIKIDNHDRARPQFGINQADIVYEEIVEGGITRFAAVFHSTDADPVGPIRSVRTSDFDLLSNLNTPLFANSGGNPTVLGLLRDVDIVDVGAVVSQDSYYRDDSRRPPHNLLSSTEALWSAGSGGGQVPALLSYLGAEPSAGRGRITNGVVLDFGSNSVEYSWDPDLSGWARSQNDTPHVDADGVRIAPPNVIVQFVVYGRSPADERSPEVQLVGSGEAWVFVAGELVEATWSRESSDSVTEFIDGEGDPVRLDPGPTWVALVRLGQATELG